jgi:hypothetical protein
MKYTEFVQLSDIIEKNDMSINEWIEDPKDLERIDESLIGALGLLILGAWALQGLGALTIAGVGALGWKAAKGAKNVILDKATPALMKLLGSKANTKYYNENIKTQIDNFKKEKVESLNKKFEPYFAKYAKEINQLKSKKNLSKDERSQLSRIYKEQDSLIQKFEGALDKLLENEKNILDEKLEKSFRSNFLKESDKTLLKQTMELELVLVQADVMNALINDEKISGEKVKERITNENKKDIQEKTKDANQQINLLRKRNPKEEISAMNLLLQQVQKNPKITKEIVTKRYNNSKFIIENSDKPELIKNLDVIYNKILKVIEEKQKQTQQPQQNPQQSQQQTQTTQQKPQQTQQTQPKPQPQQTQQKPSRGQALNRIANRK